MGKRIIECSVSDEYLLGGGVPIGAAGSHDDVVLRLAFGDAWAGLNIYATFTDALGQQSIVVLLLPSMLVPGEAMTYDVPIPAVAKRESGRMLLGLTGYMIVNGNEDMATHTAEAFFRVLPSKVALADDGSVDATLAQQLQDELNKFADVYIEESERQENEIIRQASETEREEAEALRAAAETERVAAEADREDAESARVLAENERGAYVGEVDTALDEILKIQDELLDSRVEAVTKEEVIAAINTTLLGSLFTQMESGWYKGTDAETMSLVFSFAPRLILIVGRVYRNSNYYACYGFIDTERQVHSMLIQKDNETPRFHFFSKMVSVEGTTVTLNNENTSLHGFKGAVVFNISGGTPDYTPVTETSGYGYTYYAFG
jgi:hypothetical protein